MTKKITFMLLLLALAVGLYALNVKADGGEAVTNTAQPSSVPAMTEAAMTCEVYTGIEGGTVNLRTCAGTSCGVLDIVTEGERLTILTVGLWTHVTTKDGVTGWLNSNYCKGK